MDSRRAILETLRGLAAAAAPLPDLAGEQVRYADPAAQFAAALRDAGGACLRVADLTEAAARLHELPACRPDAEVISLVPGVGRSTVDVAAVRDPHALEGLELAVLPGALAVAENGAVWVPGGRLPYRALVVVPQHLALVVAASALVHNLHDAYARIALERPGFGVFLAGPSKTADIEQALVIGAHGARSCTVFLVGPP